MSVNLRLIKASLADARFALLYGHLEIYSADETFKDIALESLERADKELVHISMDTCEVCGGHADYYSYERDRLFCEPCGQPDLTP